jgi:two-component sensor histidine kinase
LNLDLERAIPAGLIANELILNSIKHGLRERSGLLTVKLARVAAPATLNNDELGWAELVIADTGRGLPPELDPATAKSMGLRLVSMLVRQLRGRLEIRDGIGAAISVTFPLENISSGLEEVG